MLQPMTVMSQTHNLCPSKGYSYEKTIDNRVVQGNRSFGGFGGSNRTRVVQSALVSLESNPSLYGDFKRRETTLPSDIKTYIYHQRLQFLHTGLSV